MKTTCCTLTRFNSLMLTGLAISGLLSACAQTQPSEPHSVAPAQIRRNVGVDLHQTLNAYRWSLAAAYGPTGQRENQWFLAHRPVLQLTFSGDHISVGQLCNRNSAAYQLAGDRIEVNAFASTKMACEIAGLMDLESRTLKQLTHASSVEVLRPVGAGDTPRLYLRFIDGRRWNFIGAPTTEARYGGSGEKLFLEIDAQLAPCSASARAQCLRVRELRFDANGRRSSVGDWKLLKMKQIEGFQYERGLRKVVRIKRHPAANQRTGQTMYVVDEVVESVRED